MRILLTGVTGYIARFLLPVLNKSSNELHAVVRKTSNIESVRHYFRSVHFFIDSSDLRSYMSNLNPDVVVHLSGYLRISENLFDIDNLIKTNILFSLEILDACTNLNSHKCVFVNIDTYQAQPCREDSSRYAYYYSKRIFREIVMLYSLSSIVRILNLKLSNVYGPLNKRSILNIMIEGQISGKKVKIENPNDKVDFIYVDDAVTGINHYINYMVEYSKEDFFETNIISGKKISLKKLQKLIVNINGNYIYKDERINTLPWTLSRLEKNSWIPSVELIKGIYMVISGVNKN